MSVEATPQSRKVARAQWVIVGLMALSFGLDIVSDGPAVQVLGVLLFLAAGLVLVFTILMRRFGPWRERR